MNPQGVASSIYRAITQYGSQVTNLRTGITSMAIVQSLDAETVVEMRQQGAINEDAGLPKTFTFGHLDQVQETDELVHNGWVWVADQVTPREAFGIVNRITVVALRTRSYP